MLNHHSINHYCECVNYLIIFNTLESGSKETPRKVNLTLQWQDFYFLAPGLSTSEVFHVIHSSLIIVQ